jgi:succinate-acetate transporter protein
MSGLAIASLVQSGFDLRWISKSQELQVGLILVAVPFVMQGLATVFAYLARDGAAGSAMGVLSTTWLAIGLIHIVSVPGHRSGAVGLLLLASAWMLTLTSAAVASAKPLPAAVFTTVGLRFALAGIYELGGTAPWREAAGIIGLVAVAAAGYGALAFELEGQQRRPVLPTFRRGRGRIALLGSADAAVDDVLHDPGVRQTT